MIVSFIADQIGGDSSSTPYTGDPIQLLLSDIWLFFCNFLYLPGIVMPMGASRPDDELYHSIGNIYAIVLHIFLIAFQLAFLLAVILVCLPPLCFMVPIGPALASIVGFVTLNWYVCKLLNGSDPTFESTVAVRYHPEHENERWIFLNGVAVGRHWLKSNVNRISTIFGRRVLGVHNPTTGIIFDTIECLIQRNFGYVTMDIRNAYVKVKEALYDSKYKKVVFIIHSQGAIEGGMIVDWLLDETPRDLLGKLEIYSFGNAANHFNNPYQHVYPAQPGTAGANAIPNTSVSTNVEKRSPNVSTTLNASSPSTALLRRGPHVKALRHIEHYANTGDFVSEWGVLHFTNTVHCTSPVSSSPAASVPNSFMGSVFINKISGHQLNQHYLSNMFALTADGKRAADTNDFMEQDVIFFSDDHHDSGHSDRKTRDQTQSITTNSNRNSGAITVKVGPRVGRLSIMESLAGVYGSTSPTTTSLLSSLPSANERQRHQPQQVEFRSVDSPIDDYAGRRIGIETVLPGGVRRTLKVKDLSRLWQYRNGASPQDDA